VPLLRVAAGIRRLPTVVLAVAIMLTAAFLGSAMNAVIRLLSDDLHPFEIAFFRNALALVTLAPLVARAGLSSLRTTKLRLHALRGVLNAVAMLTFFWGLARTPLAEVAALGFTSPLFATLLAALILKERVGPRRSLALLIGFAGALVIIRPGFGAVGAGQVALLVSALAWAAALTDIKVLARTETSLTITVYAAGFLTPITLLAALPFWQWPSGQQFLLLCAVAGFGTFYQLAVAQAFRMADTSQVLPADFTKLIWAAALGWILFAEVPDVWVFVGGAVIFAAVFYVSYRESRLRQAALPAAPRPH
jgi:drug/metabolite transporter (DMT)-like permease